MLKSTKREIESINLQIADIYRMGLEVERNFADELNKLRNRIEALEGKKNKAKKSAPRPAQRDYCNATCHTEKAARQSMARHRVDGWKMTSKTVGEDGKIHLSFRRIG